jgi:thioredoxin
VSQSAAIALGEISEARFDEEVLTAAGPVLVEFFATWCGSCRGFAPTLQQVAAEYAGRVTVMQVNAEENPELVRRYGMSSTPTLLLFAGGEPTATLVGAQSADALRELLNAIGVERPSPVPAAWVPVDACTLPTAAQPLRVAEFEALFASALRGIERRRPGWLRLHLDGNTEVKSSARELTARESSCCSFFDFQLTATDNGLVLDVRVPDERIEVLDGLARQAEAARRGAGTGSGTRA